MDEGLSAVSAGKPLDATLAFDKVLARAPFYERRKEMVKTYLEAARLKMDEHPEDAVAMLRKAWRLDPSGQYTKPIQSEIAYLEGVLSVRQSTPDKAAFERAIALDASNNKARIQLERLQDKALERQGSRRRFWLALAVALVAVLSMMALTRLRGPHKPTNPSP